MEDKYPNDHSLINQAVEGRKTEKGFTPRELIHHHINHPDEPIRDEDIQNLVLHTPVHTSETDSPIDTEDAAADSRMLSDTALKQADGNSITTPHDILDI